MTLNLPESHEAALEWTQRIVAGVQEIQWSNPTPCEEWNARTLLNHIVAGNYWVAPLVEGKTIEEVGDKYDGDLLEHDAYGAYERSAKIAAHAFFEPGAMTALCAVSYGPVPGAVYCGHRIFDVTVHGWDLATGTGQDATIPVELVEACHEIIEPQAEALRQAGVLGPKVKLGSKASKQANFLALIGRS